MKSFSGLFLGLFLVVGTAIGTSSAFAQASRERRQLSHDFYVSVVDDAAAATPGKAVRTRYQQLLEKGPLGIGLDLRAACEASFKAAICETTSNTDEITYDYANVTCDANSAQYVPALMDLYDETPEKMRASLCSLERIFLSDAIPSVAFATAIQDRSGRVVGGYIGMRKQSFLSQPSTHEIVSWKEQLAYGGSNQFLANNPKLVQISYDLKMTKLKSDGLFYVVMHELGHLIDFNNDVNSNWGSPTDWSRLSWSNSNRPLASATFYLRDQFCFYDCSRYLKPTEAKAIYASLLQSGFLTTYASSNPFEDFAEFWAWHLMVLYKSPNYQIEVPGETVFNMNAMFTGNPKIQKKIDFIDNLWNSSALKFSN